MKNNVPDMVFEMYGRTVYVMYRGTNLGMPASQWIEHLKSMNIDTTEFEKKVKQFEETH